METFIFIWVFLFGLAIGSFLNVVIYRVPRHKNFLMSRSVCPYCSHQLKWYHNIPMVSYLFLKGKCAFCKHPISFRYPLVEIINALVYVFFFWQWGMSINFFIYVILSSVLIVIFFIDLDFQIIPDVITLPCIVVGLAVSFLPGEIGIVKSLLGLLVGGGALYLIALLGDWLFKKESMGGGDIKMAAMLGAFVGWQKVILIFMSAAVIGLVVSVVLMLFSSQLRQKRIIPFGPFLAMAAMLSISYGERIINFYFTHFINLH